jgi:hypothetical protein
LIGGGSAWENQARNPENSAEAGGKETGAGKDVFRAAAAAAAAAGERSKTADGRETEEASKLKARGPARQREKTSRAKAFAAMRGGGKL